ncbi:MAG: S-layer homology domain-containing protein [Clostridia bacterium]|nr:S-layer homology domain-containing protein [Clostridia bacterium]
MKNLKKVLSLLVALTIVFSCFAVFAEDETTEATETTESTVTSDVEATTTFTDITSGTTLGEAVLELVANNIISGYPDGTFRPDGAITRAEFATVIARFSGIASNLAADAVTGFKDLDADSSRAWCRPYVKAAYDAGIISGFEDGTFRAGDPVTYEQAVKMVICAIKYDVIALSEHNKLMATNPGSVTWSSGYIAAANKNGITKNAIVGNVSQNATRGLVAILACNALNAPKINQTTDSNGNVSYEVSGETNKDDVADSKEKIEGIVSGTYYTSLTSQTPDLEVNEIEITKTDGTKVDYVLSSSILSKVDLEDLLGTRVTAYYSKADGEIVSYTDKNTKVTKIEESQLLRPLSGSSIKYTDSSDKTQSISVSGYSFIYNGKYMESMNLDTLDSMFDNGYIEIVETSGAKLVKVKSYSVGVVSSFDKNKEKIFFRYGKDEYTFPSRTADKPDIYIGTSKTATEFTSLSLSAYDVVNIYESPDDAEGAAVRKMFVTKGSKSGKVTSVSDTERMVVLNDKEFYLTNDYNEYTPESDDEEKAPFELGESYIYYLDYTGQIAAVKYNSATAGTYQYGYIFAVGENDDNSQAIRMITSSGTDTVYTLKSNVKFDGEKIKDTQVAERLRESALVANEGYMEKVEAWGGTPNGTEYSQLVRYSLSGTYVDSIDTVIGIKGGSGDLLSHDITVAYGQTTNSSSTQLKQSGVSFTVDSSTKILYVPDDRTDDSSYAVMTNSNAFPVSGKTYYIDAFGIDEKTKKAAFVLIYAINPTLIYRSTSPYMIVSRRYYDGDQLCFEGYVGTSTSLSTVKVSEYGYKDLSSVEPKAEARANVVDKGDVIRYIKDNKGEIVSLMVWYDADNPTQAEGVSTFNEAKENRMVSITDSGSSIELRYGMPLDVDAENKTIRLTLFVESDELDEDEDMTDTSNARDYTCTSTKIFELTKSGVSVLESLDNVYDIDSGSPSTILVISKVTVDAPALWIYVINNK